MKALAPASGCAQVAAGVLGSSLDRARAAYAGQMLLRRPLRHAIGKDVGWFRSVATCRALYEELAANPPADTEETKR